VSVPGGYPTEKCVCGVEFLWAEHERTTKLAPINASPDPAGGGNVELVLRGRDRAPLYRVLSVAERFGRTTTLHKSHFAACPRAPRFRRSP
jgi:hypothetical protein